MACRHTKPHRHTWQHWLPHRCASHTSWYTHVRTHNTHYTTQCKCILGTSRSRMQQPIASCTRAQTITGPCPCATCIWLLHPAPTSDQDGLDPLQLALVVVFILPSISTKTSLALVVVFFYIPTTTYTICAHMTCHAATTHCNLHWWCFSSTNQAFANVHTCTWTHVLQLGQVGTSRLRNCFCLSKTPSTTRSCSFSQLTTRVDLIALSLCTLCLHCDCLSI